MCRRVEPCLRRRAIERLRRACASLHRLKHRQGWRPQQCLRSTKWLSGRLSQDLGQVIIARLSRALEGDRIRIQRTVGAVLTAGANSGVSRCPMTAGREATTAHAAEETGGAQSGSAAKCEGVDFLLVETARLRPRAIGLLSTENTKALSYARPRLASPLPRLDFRDEVSRRRERKFAPTRRQLAGVPPSLSTPPSLTSSSTAPELTPSSSPRSTTSVTCWGPEILLLRACRCIWRWAMMCPSSSTSAGTSEDLLYWHRD